MWRLFWSMVFWDTIKREGHRVTSNKNPPRNPFRLIFLGAVAMLLLTIACCCGSIFWPQHNRDQNKPVASKPTQDRDNSPTNVSSSEVTAPTADKKSNSEIVVSLSTPDSMIADRIKEQEAIVDEWLSQNPEPKPPKFLPDVWYSEGLSHKTEGSIVGASEEAVTIRKTDGSEVTVPRVKLAAGSNQKVEDSMPFFTAYQSRHSQWTERSESVQEKLNGLKKIQQEKARIEREKKNAIAKAKYDEERNRHYEQKKLDDAVSKINSLFSEADYVDSVYLRSDHVLIVALENSWHYHPKQIRLQEAQAIGELWMEMDPKKRGRFELEDLSGNRIGGLGVLGVWVDD